VNLNILSCIVLLYIRFGSVYISLLFNVYTVFYYMTLLPRFHVSCSVLLSRNVVT